MKDIKKSFFLFFIFLILVVSFATSFSDWDSFHGNITKNRYDIPSGTWTYNRSDYDINSNANEGQYVLASDVDGGDDIEIIVHNFNLPQLHIFNASNPNHIKYTIGYATSTSTGQAFGSYTTYDIDGDDINEIVAVVNNESENNIEFSAWRFNGSLFIPYRHFTINDGYSRSHAEGIDCFEGYCYTKDDYHRIWKWNIENNTISNITFSIGIDLKPVYSQIIDNCNEYISGKEYYTMIWNFVTQKQELIMIPIENFTSSNVRRYNLTTAYTHQSLSCVHDVNGDNYFAIVGTTYSGTTGCGLSNPRKAGILFAFYNFTSSEIMSNVSGISKEYTSGTSRPIDYSQGFQFDIESDTINEVCFLESYYTCVNPSRFIRYYCFEPSGSFVSNVIYPDWSGYSQKYSDRVVIGDFDADNENEFLFKGLKLEPSDLSYSQLYDISIDAGFIDYPAIVNFGDSCNNLYYVERHYEINPSRTTRVLGLYEGDNCNYNITSLIGNETVLQEIPYVTQIIYDTVTPLINQIDNVNVYAKDNQGDDIYFAYTCDLLNEIVDNYFYLDEFDLGNESTLIQRYHGGYDDVIYYDFRNEYVLNLTARNFTSEFYFDIEPPVSSDTEVQFEFFDYLDDTPRGEIGGLVQLGKSGNNKILYGIAVEHNKTNNFGRIYILNKTGIWDLYHSFTTDVGVPTSYEVNLDMINHRFKVIKYRTYTLDSNFESLWIDYLEDDDNFAEIYMFGYPDHLKTDGSSNFSLGEPNNNFGSSKGTIFDNLRITGNSYPDFVLGEDIGLNYSAYEFSCQYSVAGRKTLVVWVTDLYHMNQYTSGIQDFIYVQESNYDENQTGTVIENPITDVSTELLGDYVNEDGKTGIPLMIEQFIWFIQFPYRIALYFDFLLTFQLAGCFIVILSMFYYYINLHKSGADVGFDKIIIIGFLLATVLVYMKMMIIYFYMIMVVLFAIMVVSHWKTGATN